MSFAHLIAMPVDQSVDPFSSSGNDPHNDFFDQFITFDSVNTQSSIPGLTPEPPALLESESGPESVSAYASKSKDDASHELAHLVRGEPAERRSALPREDSKGNVLQSDILGRASKSTFDLLSLEGISLQSPQIKAPPSFPSFLVPETNRGRPRFIDRISKTFRKDPNVFGQRRSSPAAKFVCPPKKMQRSHDSEENINDWGDQIALDASNFDFGFQNAANPLSSPPSARISEASNQSNGIMVATQQDLDNFSWNQAIPQNFAYRNPVEIESPLATPLSDITTFQEANIHQDATKDFVYGSPQGNQPSALWTTPISSEYSFGASAAYITEEETTSLWWAHEATVPLAQPAPRTFPAQPAAHNSKSLPMQLPIGLAHNANELSMLHTGLMIQMPHSPNQQSFVVESASIGQEQGYFAPAGTALLATPAQPHLQNQYPLSQPRPQPLPSPNRHQHQHQNQYASQKAHRDKSHSRTDSSSSPSPTSRAASFHVAKKRSSSRKRADAAALPKTPRLGLVAGPAGADFVNFTPDDSMKILTGVAPSGSSKTKARREREAMEKSRRLSQAAVRAVREVGGNLDRLFEEGLLGPPRSGV